MAEITKGLAGDDEPEEEGGLFLASEDDEGVDEAEEPFWQIRESHEPRSVVHLGVVCDPEKSLTRSFFRGGLRAECHRLSQAVVRYRDEEGETSRLVETWAPCDLVPLGVHARFDNENEIVEWLHEDRSMEIRRIESRVGLVWPTPEEDALLLERFADQPILRVGRSYIAAEGRRLIVWQWERATQHCILGFDRDLAPGDLQRHVGEPKR